MNQFSSRILLCYLTCLIAPTVAQSPIGKEAVITRENITICNCEFKRISLGVRFTSYDKYFVRQIEATPKENQPTTCSTTLWTGKYLYGITFKLVNDLVNPTRWAYIQHSPLPKWNGDSDSTSPFNEVKGNKTYCENKPSKSLFNDDLTGCFTTEGAKSFYNKGFFLTDVYFWPDPKLSQRVLDEKKKMEQDKIIAKQKYEAKKKQDLETTRTQAAALEKAGKHDEAMKLWDEFEKKYPEEANTAKSERLNLYSKGNVADQQKRDQVETANQEALLITMVTAGIFMYKGIGKDKPKNVFTSNSWRFNFTCGYSYAQMPIYENKEFETYNGSTYQYSYSVSKGPVLTLNLDMGMQFWPYYGKNAGLGIMADGFVGYLPLSGSNAAYSYNYGGQGFFGLEKFKLTASYLIGDRGFDRSQVFSSSLGETKTTGTGATKFSRLMAGPRITINTANSIGHLDILYISEQYKNLDAIKATGINVTWATHNRLKAYGEFLFQAARMGVIESGSSFDSDVKNTGPLFQVGVIRSIDVFGQK